VGVRFTASTLITALVAAVVFVAPASADKGKSSDQRDVAPSDAPATANRAVRGQVVVRLLAPNQLQAITAQFGLDPTPVDQMALQGLFLLSVSDGTSAEAKAGLLEADPRVQYAEANYAVQAPEGTGMSSWESGDPAQYAAQWAPAAMRLDEAQRITRGRGVRVAVFEVRDVLVDDLADLLEDRDGLEREPLRRVEAAEADQGARCDRGSERLGNSHDSDVRIDRPVERKILGQRVHEHQRVVDMSADDRLFRPRLGKTQATLGVWIQLAAEDRLRKQTT